MDSVNYKNSIKNHIFKSEPTLSNSLEQKILSQEPLLKRNDKVTVTRLPVRKFPYIRAVSKKGHCNIFPTNIDKTHFLRDIFTTLVDLKWRYVMTTFTLGFFLSWTIFASLWWLIAHFHGDFEEHHLPMHQKAYNWTPCVTDLYAFSSCFLFSVETQQTTGYGEKRPTERCTVAIVLMSIQNIVGLVIDAFLVGIIFAKLVRPKKRSETIQFSKYAVISMRDNTLCLMFRLGDMREKSRIIEAKLKVQLVTQNVSKSGEIRNNYMTKLNIIIDNCENDLIFLWPITVVHKIDETSPFFHLSKDDLIEQNFEIIATLEGTIESTDQKTQARTSYLSSEILWGYRFESVMSVCQQKCGYKIDYSKFDRLCEDNDTLEYSAYQIKLRNKGVPICAQNEPQYSLYFGVQCHELLQKHSKERKGISFKWGCGLLLDIEFQQIVPILMVDINHISQSRNLCEIELMCDILIFCIIS